MGNKAAKQYYLKRKYGSIGSEENCCSDEDLAEFLAALSSMANRGHHQSHHQSRSLPVVTRDDSYVARRTQSSTSSPSSASLKDKRRKRMTRSKAVVDDTALIQRNRDNSQDWAEMREWLLWCMQSNLKEEIEVYKHNQVENQSSLESNCET